jgi:glycosyltransferase involved in cell wall biosynthesis
MEKAEMSVFPGRAALQQRVLPAYRAPFFDALASTCQDGLSVFAGKAPAAENISTVDRLQVARYVPAQNRHIFTINSPLYQCWQAGFLDWLQDWQPDVLVVEANPRYPSTRSAIRWMHAHDRPVIGWGLGAPSLEGGMPLAGLVSSLRQRQRLSLINSLDGLIAYSQRGAQEYQQLGFPQERIFVAPNAVTPRPAAPLPERHSHFEGAPVILFVGRLQARKRIDNLLRACAALPDQLQPRLLVVGDGPAREQFQELANDIYPSAEFPGALHGSELEPYFKQSDLFVLPGTGGLAVQQAMAHGLPVIVAQGDGTQDDLVRAENGWTIPPDDLDALMTGLQTALSDPTALRRMGAASYRIVSQEINLEAMVSVFVRAMNYVVAEYKAR